MPFIGQDWRSPGEAWVKTETLGWQRMKIIESQLYPSCHQSPACSWPPRSAYGQHMDNHCGAGRNDDTATTVTDQLGSGEPAMRTGSLSSSDTTSPASSSAGSSRASSLSPSPSGSPEKSAHHIHPIAISSPYGWHSCFAHHSATNCCAKNHQSSAIMSRSLSKESLVSAGNCLLARQKSTMRHNRSVSDFRSTDQEQNCETTSASDEQSAQSATVTNGCVHLSPPTLMKNGQRIDTSDDTNDDNLDAHLNVGIERGRSASEADSFQPDGRKLNRPPISRPCCCCSATATGSPATAATGSPCHFYPLREPNSGTKTAPHCRISVRTREVAMYNTISEAFYRLDFCNAIHDIRRFNYICKLLHLLITQNLTSLSGCATRVLFSMLEQVAWEGKSRVVRPLDLVFLLSFNEIIKRY